MFRPLIALPALLVIAACSPDWSQMESPKENRVTYALSRHEVAFERNAERPSPEEATRLAAFLDRATSGTGDRVTLSAATPLDVRRATQIAAGLRRRGITVDVVTDAVPADRVLVSVGHYSVIPPACPDWTRRSESDFTNLPSSNFGCATAMNLGQMVADPGDLMRGRTPAGGDADAAVLAIQRYRAGKIRPLSEADTQGGGK